MFTVLHALSQYTYFYTSKKITSYTFFLVFKIVESLQCILKAKYYIQGFPYLGDWGVTPNEPTIPLPTWNNSPQ